MHLYGKLSQVPFLHRYSYKFLFIAFAGIHIPLLGIIGILAFSPAAWLTPLTLMLLAAGLTLIATAATLYLLNQLIAPILLMKDALEKYLYARTIPHLPIMYTDEAGLLMQDIQHTITSLDALLTEKRDLLGMLAHELRSPTNSVLSIIEFLKTQEDTPEKQQHYWNIQQLMTGQLELMNTMLSIMQHDESWESFSEKQTLYCQDIFNGALYQLDGAIRQKGIAIDCQIPEYLRIVTEKQSLGQVLVNVLSNAIKFSHIGGLITITASADIVSNQVIITIEDEGIGFRTSYAEELFERFTNRRRWGTQNEPTYGLGLYLCRKVMQRHGGHISAYSAGEGKGATFTLLLPQPELAEVPDSVLA